MRSKMEHAWLDCWVKCPGFNALGIFCPSNSHKVQICDQLLGIGLPPLILNLNIAGEIRVFLLGTPLFNSSEITGVMLYYVAKCNCWYFRLPVSHLTLCMPITKLPDGSLLLNVTLNSLTLSVLLNEILYFARHVAMTQFHVVDHFDCCR